MAAAPPPSAPGGPEPPPGPPLQYSMLLQHLVGEQRRPRAWDPATLGGIPSPPKSEEQKMVERAMESCAFKAALACVGGAVGRLREAGRGWRDSWGGPPPWGREREGRDEIAAQGPPCFSSPSPKPPVYVTAPREGFSSAFFAKEELLTALPQHSLSATASIV